MKETETLGEQRVIELMTVISEAIRDNYVRGPISRDRCYEALNALAGATALVIKGTGEGQGEAHEWFERALAQQLWEES
jgi:hypothetical protein